MLNGVEGLVRPWLAPEITSIQRLPMHSVPHTDRIELDGSWSFQLLREPDADPGPDWSTATVPGCWTMQGFDDRPQYTNVQMPFAGRPPEVRPTTRPACTSVRSTSRAPGRTGGSSCTSEPPRAC